MSERVIDTASMEMGVEVVRCIDCAHAEARGDMAAALGVLNVSCRKLGFQFPMEDMARRFCAWGKRRGA